MKLAFAYIRRSSYKQQDNNSVEIQKQHIKEFAKRNNLNVPDEFIFIEDVTSAYTKRASQRKMLMYLGDKMIELNISNVIFHDVSRMDRTGYSFAIDFFRPMREKIPDLEVYTTKSDKPLDLEDPSVQLNFLLFQYESEIKSERAIGTLLTDLENEEKIRPGSKVPYGYQQVNKQLTPNDNADIVSFIFFLSTWGYSLKKIASLLNNAQIPSPKGRVWGTSTIENILKNTAYTGNLTWKVPKRKDSGKTCFILENTHEPLINDYLPQLVTQNKMLQKLYGRLDTPFLFLNKIKCKHCNETLVTQNGSTKRKEIVYKYEYYVCKSCDYKVPSKEVHDKYIPLVLKHVKKLASTNDTVYQTLKYIDEMTTEVENFILTTEENLIKLSEKHNLAKKMNDRELEIHILKLKEEYKFSLIEYINCQKRLIDLYQLVESTQFFSRFDEILDCHLGINEKRLLILYFVDSLFMGIDQESHIHFKSNVFSELTQQFSG